MKRGFPVTLIVLVVIHVAISLQILKISFLTDADRTLCNSRITDKIETADNTSEITSLPMMVKDNTDNILTFKNIIVTTP